MDPNRSRIYCSPFYFTREYIRFYIFLTKLHPYFKMEVSLFYLAILVIFKSSKVVSSFLISIEGPITVQVSSGLTQPVPGGPDELLR